MATNQTTNYQLNQWEPTDQVLRTDFNADNAKLDAALADLTEDVSEKASQTALDALSSTVAGHTAAIAQCGNCTLWTTSYAGTGQYGEDHPSSLTFPKMPLLVILGGSNGHLMFFLAGQAAVSGIELDFNEPCFWTPVTWSGTTVSWYSDTAMKQMNHSNYTYYALALLNAEE